MKTIILHGENTQKSYDRLTKFINEAKRRDWEILYDQVSSTPSLFGKERLSVIRDYKLFNQKIKFNGTLVIYSDRDLPVAFLKTLPTDAKIEKYDLTKTIWKFLNRPTISGLHEVIKTEAIEFVFAMLARTLKRQKKFDLISELARIDIESKTGQVDLTLALDLFIVKHLE